jgi:hypothetical protein
MDPTVLDEIVATLAGDEQLPDVDVRSFCERAFDGLPATVVRDVCAPPVDSGYGTSRVLLKALLRSAQDSSSLPIKMVVFEGDGAFLEACVTTVAMSGDQLDLPWTPRFGSWLEGVEAPLGWFRLACGRTSGTKLHDINCRSLSRVDSKVEDAETMNLWQRWLGSRHICGVCCGPQLVPFVELFAYRAAVDCWRARPSVVEAWQITALQRLMSAAMRDRVRMAEPDRLLLGRIYDALSVDPLAEEGWHAQWATTIWRSREYGSLTEDEKERARVLAHRRLSIFSSVLPVSTRPMEPPKFADEQALGEWKRQLFRHIPDDDTTIDNALFALRLPAVFLPW